MVKLKKKSLSRRGFGTHGRVIGNKNFFSKRSGAASKGFEPCEFWFQFKSSFVCSGIVSMS